MTFIRHGVAAAITMAGAIVFSGVALASSADFIDNGHYTTDTNNGLDWLDVTISVNQSYNYVSSQFGSGGEYEGWRYATGIEFNHMVSSWTGTIIDDTNYGYVTHYEGVLDGLPLLLGNTLYPSDPVGAELGYTEGYLADIGPSFTNSRYVALVFDDLGTGNAFNFTIAHATYSNQYQGEPYVGSFLVRDTLNPVPVPAAVWLMGSSLLGLLSYSRHIKPTIAA